MIAIIDYGMGNLRSVQKGFEKIGAEAVVTADPRVVLEAERIVRIGYAQGGYLFNTGEMNPRDTPAENMRAMIAAVRRTAADMGSR